MPGSDPTTIDSLAQFVADYVSGHFSVTGQPVSGANLATAVRQKFGDFSYEQVGVTKLGDIVARAELKGLVVRNRQVTHLELFPTAQKLAVGTAERGSQAEAPGRWIRPDVWRALVFIPQKAVHLIRRKTGEMVSVPNTGPSEVGEYSGVDHATLKPIPPDIQKAWAKDFLAARKIEDLSLETPDGRWWVPFLARVKHDARLNNDWNRYRVERVSTYLDDWARQNDVDSSTLFSTARPNRRAFLAAQAVGIKSDEEEIRQAIVESVKEMNLDELKAIAIPVRCILRHFRAR